MENDFDIEILPNEEEAEESVQLPVNFLAFGEIEPDDVKVYIKQDVYKALEKLASSDTSTELGSIILGDYADDLGKMNVVISEYIEAKYTDASASTLTFTHETWDYVHAEHEKKFPEKKIVGWQHTHPNYGIFLSNYDLFIQENFFNMPFQVAYVIDPIQNIRGFFQWKDGKITKLRGYYIYDDVGKPIKIEQTKVEKKTEVPAKKTTPWISVVTVLLCVAVAILSIVTYSLNAKYQEQLEAQEELSDTVDEQSLLIAAQAQEIAELEDSDTADTEDTKDSSGDTVTFISYTVAQGDTLSGICSDHGLDYSNYKNIILAVNGISSPNQIYAGETLLLPVVE